MSDAADSSETGGTPVLQASGVTKSFPSPTGIVPVLRNVSLGIREGEFMMLTGPSGSGKTTFLNLAGMLDQPTAGSLTFDGNDVSSFSELELCRARKMNVGMVFQRFCLLPHRSVIENVMFRFRYVDHDRASMIESAKQILDRVGLSDAIDRPARLLSSGEMQRTAIARAVVLRPRILIADEPTGNLDSAAAETVMNCFHELNDDGITILMATHNESLLSHGSRCIRCSDGVILDTADD